MKPNSDHWYLYQCFSAYNFTEENANSKTITLTLNDLFLRTQILRFCDAQCCLEVEVSDARRRVTATACSRTLLSTTLKLLVTLRKERSFYPSTHVCVCM